jgi:hypothetical protein
LIVGEYEVVFSEAAARSFGRLSRARQRSAGVALDAVRLAPFRAGDFAQLVPDGRTHQVHLIGDWLVTCWTDHAVKEIRVVDLERADE